MHRKHPARHLQGKGPPFLSPPPASPSEERDFRGGLHGGTVCRVLSCRLWHSVFMSLLPGPEVLPLAAGVGRAPAQGEVFRVLPVTLH